MSSRSEALQGKKLVRQEYPCPPGAQDIGIAVTEILEEGSGAVFKLILEMGQPIKYWRYVDRNTLDEDDVDMAGMMGRTAINEVAQMGAQPFELLFHMMTIPLFENLVPAYWIMGDVDYLYDWLGVKDSWTRGLPTLMGLPVRQGPDVPSDVLLIAGAMSVDAGLKDIVRLWKAVMLRRSNSEQGDGHVARIGTNLVRESQAVEQVEDASRRLGAEGQRPTDLFRERLRKCR